MQVLGALPLEADAKARLAWSPVVPPAPVRRGRGSMVQRILGRRAVGGAAAPRRPWRSSGLDRSTYCRAPHVQRARKSDGLLVKREAISSSFFALACVVHAHFLDKDGLLEWSGLLALCERNPRLGRFENGFSLGKLPGIPDLCKRTPRWRL